MTCVKCGREIPEDQSFCEKCLAAMDVHPIPENVAIRLPQRTEAPPRKQPKKRGIPLEVQVKQLNKLLRIQSIVLILAAILIALMIPITVTHLMEEHYEVGQNYTAIPSGTRPEGAQP